MAKPPLPPTPSTATPAGGDGAPRALDDHAQVTRATQGGW